MNYEMLTLIVSGLASVSSILIAVFAIRQVGITKTQAQTERTQTDMMQQELDASLRPWIGATKGLDVNKLKKYLSFQYKNYGQVPSLSMRERFGIGDNIFTQESVQMFASDVHHRSAMLPGQEGSFHFPVDSQLLSKAIIGEKPLFVWILIDYHYGGDKRGEYGIIEEYRPNIGNFIIKDEWVK